MHTSVSHLDQTSVKALIDTHIRSYCGDRRLHAKKVGERYVLFWDTIETLLLAGGKRFRPYMTLLAYESYAPTAIVTDILPAALAQELLHAAVLIHDDIIDRDTIRYGVKNIAGQYSDIYECYTNSVAKQEHLSLSAALLAGDILLSDAHRLVRAVNCPEERITQAAEILSMGIFEVIGGELLDSEAAILPVGVVKAERVARHKTASYSFVSPLTMGAALAGASIAERALLGELSENVGVGYQLRDDFLGIFGQQLNTGKSTSTDIIEGKRTFIIEQFDALATNAQKKRFYQLFHRIDVTDRDIEEARSLLIASGAKAAINARIDTLHSKANDIVTKLTISNEAKVRFRDLITQCLEREG